MSQDLKKIICAQAVAAIAEYAGVAPSQKSQNTYIFGDYEPTLAKAIDFLTIRYDMDAWDHRSILALATERRAA